MGDLRLFSGVVALVLNSQMDQAEPLETLARPPTNSHESSASVGRSLQVELW